MFHVAHINQRTQTNKIYQKCVEKSKLVKNRGYDLF